MTIPDSPLSDLPLDALDPLDEQALLLALAPIAPPPAGRARMLAQLRSQTAPAGTASMLTVRREQGQWIQIAPRVERKTLMQTATMSAFLFRLAPGGVLPEHEHDGDEESLCLEGEAVLDDGLRIATGDFHFAPAGGRHPVLRSPGGCLLYVRCAHA
ncbi:MAG: cupin domain-containing protein [Pseudomonadota bacterium]